MRRRSGEVVSTAPQPGQHRSEPLASPAVRHDTSSVVADAEHPLSAHKPRHSITLPHRGRSETDGWLAIVERGQILGFRALVLILATIITLALIGQPWVAGILATALAAIVATFVTGRYNPPSTRVSEVTPDDTGPPAAEMTS